MMHHFNPIMLKLARESRGLSQIELCNKLSVTQGTVSKIENGLAQPAQEFLLKLSEVLRYPMNFFYQTSQVYSIDLVYFRRKMNLSNKSLSVVESKMNIARILVEKLLESIEIPDSSSLSWDVEMSGSPEKAARWLRDQWQIPKGRIENPVQLLEDRGIIIVPLDFEGIPIDGLSMVTKHNVPLIFVSKNIPPDRQLLTIYHEFAHILLHLRTTDSRNRDVESEAFEFASEFLVPLNEFRSNFTSLDIPTLKNLKAYWNISMSALLMKAGRSTLITKHQEKYLWAQMARLGYKKNEPANVLISYPQPSLLKDMLQLYRTYNKYTFDELAKMMCLSTEDFNIYFDLTPDPPKVKIIKFNRL